MAGSQAGQPKRKDSSMPTYEYECVSSGRRFDFFQSINDAPLAICPSCGGEVRKLISSGGGIIFKGSGFYETDYKRKNKGASTGS